MVLVVINSRLLRLKIVNLVLEDWQKKKEVSSVSSLKKKKIFSPLQLVYKLMNLISVSF